MAVIRPLGYTGYLQQLTWLQGNNVPFRAYLFGGGGGGGGWDVVRGGNGQGGGYATYEGVISEGDVMQVAVGGGGGPGADFVNSYGAGAAGPSYIYEGILSPPIAPVQQIPRVPGPLPEVGTTGYLGTGFYTVTGADNPNPVATDIRWWFIIQDGVVTFRSAQRAPTNMSAGIYRGSVRSYSDDYSGGGDSVNAFDLGGNFTGLTSYSGARGGNAGYGGWSGAGGGGGGATVLVLNNNVLAAAGGGGGGGGSGSRGFIQGDAPGPQGTTSGVTNGQGGQDKSTSLYPDGGGGGGGGGGSAGGNGGQTPGGDVSGQGGTGGASNGVIALTASGTTCAGSISDYWATFGRSQAGNGGLGSTTGGGLGTYTAGRGQAGIAVIEFDPYGIYVNQSGTWTPVQTTYVRDADIWKEVNATWIKKDGVWTPAWGGTAPNFGAIEGSFGILARPGYEDPDPGDDGNPGDDGSDY